MEKKSGMKKLVSWIREHKKEIIVTAVGVVVVAAVVIVCRNPEIIENVKVAFDGFRKKSQPTGGSQRADTIKQEKIVPGYGSQTPHTVTVSDAIKPAKAAETVSNACAIVMNVSAETASSETETADPMDTIPPVTVDIIPIDVREHIRKLPEGWHASEEKILSASEHGYELAPDETWVERYTKNCIKEIEAA